MKGSMSSPMRKVIVTGGNKGIGYAIIKGLFSGETPYDLTLATRTVQNGEVAIQKIQESVKNSKSILRTKQLNITDPVSIQHFADWVKHDLGPIDVLINNAAIGFWPETKTQKLETINTNLFGTMSITEKLLPFLSPEGKIIMMSSGLGKLSRQGPEVQKILGDPNLTQDKLLELSGKLYEQCEQEESNGVQFSSSAYDATKALLNAYTRWILKRQLKGEQQCFVVDPGHCKTDLGGQSALQSADDGADTPIFLTNLPWKADENYNGKFFGKRKVRDY